MKMQFRFEGGRELAAGLATLSNRVSRNVQRKALLEAGQPMAKTASVLAPRAPGEPDVADNIIVATAKRTRAGETAAVVVGPRSRFGPRSYIYPLAQELGAAHHPAQPFMRPAFEREAQGALGIIGSALMRALISRDVFGSTRSSGGGGGLL